MQEIILSKVMFYTAREKFLLHIFSFISLTLLAADEMDLSLSYNKVILISVTFFSTEEKCLLLSAQGL